MLDRATLIPKDRELLEDILKKDISAMGEDDYAVLLARRDYLSKDEMEKFRLEGRLKRPEVVNKTQKINK